MSSRQRGRGRGGRNTLAPPFQQLPLHQTPTSPEDTRMDEGQTSPVHTVPVPPSSTSSARETEPFPYPEPRQISADLRDTNLGVRLCLTVLEESFSAMYISKNKSCVRRVGIVSGRKRRCFCVPCLPSILTPVAIPTRTLVI